MTSYEVELADFFTRPNRHWCKGMMWSDIEIEIRDNPSNPKLKDWTAIMCNQLKTVCVEGVTCRRGEYFTYFENFKLFGMGVSTEGPRTDGTGVPEGPLGWPSIGRDGRGSAEYAKCVNLGCCSEGCEQHFGNGFIDKTECHSMTGTVNPDDLPDPMVAYHGIRPGDVTYFEIDKVGAHVYLEMIKMFGPNGTRAKPNFVPCCTDGEVPGTNSGGGSNG